MLEQPGEREGDGEAGGDPPIVADEEVPPETAERADVPHPRAAAQARARAAAGEARATRTKETRPTKPIDPEDREVAARPVDAGAFAAPEDPEAREQHADGELEGVLGNAGERPAHDQAGDDDEHDCRGGGGGGQADPALGAPKVTTMKATSRPSRRTPLNATVNEYQSISPRAGRGRSVGLPALARERLGLVVERLVPLARRIALRSH